MISIIKKILLVFRMYSVDFVWWWWQKNTLFLHTSPVLGGIYEYCLEDYNEAQLYRRIDGASSEGGASGDGENSSTGARSQTRCQGEEAVEAPIASPPLW